MSIVGTRPPLISETNLYELHHRARLAIKPGITGMWQVSGRSDITDFEEVVRLDGYTITRQMKEVWAVELDLLNKLLEVCKKHNISVFASGGTMLGAVRHKAAMGERLEMKSSGLQKSSRLSIHTCKSRFDFQC